MASLKIRCSSSNNNHQSSFIATVTISIALLQVITTAAALYIPDMHVARYRPVTILRRADSGEDDDLDRDASSPSGEGQSGGATDGYEDGEPDGPYDETPRDEEGQADLERFFDDHLGASERDGMDKENLPTNLVPFVVANPDFAGDLERNIVLENDQQVAGSQVQSFFAPNQPTKSEPMNANSNNNMQYYNQLNQAYPNIETRYMQLPNKKLIITRQITRGPVYKGGLDLSNVPAFFKLNNQHNNFKSNQPRERLDANGSEIVATEDDDMDRVYVTNNTKKPFKIPALNGYDPEEDFQEASRDFEERPAKRDRSSERRRSSEPEAEIKDISFNDPETDTLFNDASETDEVIFASDPYSNDLEAEIRGEQPASEQSNSSSDEEDQSNSKEQPSAQADSSAEQPVKRQQQKQRRQKKRPQSMDEDDGSWINDNVEEVDVPSQASQNSVLEKAAKRDELARQASPDESQQQQQQQHQQHRQQQQRRQPKPQPQQNEQEEPENQRMPNADYLKEDLNIDDFDDNLDV